MNEGKKFEHQFHKLLEKEDYLMIGLTWEERNNGNIKIYKLAKIE